MNVFNEEEFMELCKLYNGEHINEEVKITYFKSSYFNKVRNVIRSDRRGEVVFCVIRPNKKIITITCKEYQEGIFRIPTGGIGHNENIVNAVFRETKEELGLDVEILKFAGVLKIKFEYNDNSVYFYSYLFILSEKGGRLLLDATDDEVSDVLEATTEELQTIVNKLDNIKGKWADWGKFRYVTSNAVLKYLVENKDELNLKIKNN